VSWILIPSRVIIKFLLLFPVIGLYFLIVVKSYYSDLKERQSNNAESVWQSKECEYSEVTFFLNLYPASCCYQSFLLPTDAQEN